MPPGNDPPNTISMPSAFAISSYPTAQELIDATLREPTLPGSVPVNARNRGQIVRMARAAYEIPSPIGWNAGSEQTLEDYVFRVCRAADILEETMSVTEIAHAITALRGKKASTGAINNVLMRWKLHAFAKIGERPVRFMQFTNQTQQKEKTQ